MNKITIDYEYYKDLLKKEDLLTELKNKIGKAIEQIEVIQYNLSFNKNLIDKDLQELLEILGGNIKDENK